MKDLVSKLARFAGEPSATFGAFDPAHLFAGGSFDFAAEVAQYFHSCVPNVRLDLDLYRIFSAADIDLENRDCIPSYFCAPHGFITTATEISGDAFSVDVTDGKVYHLSHEKYESDGIHPGWNADCTAFLPTRPVTRKNIIETSEGHWTNITEFLNECWIMRPRTHKRTFAGRHTQKMTTFLLYNGRHLSDNNLQRAVTQSGRIIS